MNRGPSGWPWHTESEDKTFAEWRWRYPWNKPWCQTPSQITAQPRIHTFYYHRMTRIWLFSSQIQKQFLFFLLRPVRGIRFSILLICILIKCEYEGLVENEKNNPRDESKNRKITHTHTPNMHTPNLLPWEASIVPGGALHLLWRLGASSRGNVEGAQARCAWLQRITFVKLNITS